MKMYTIYCKMHFLWSWADILLVMNMKDLIVKLKHLLDLIYTSKKQTKKQQILTW